jgi:hypothetical protein
MGVGQMQTQLHLVGGVNVGPTQKKCHVCEVMTETRCLWCGCAICPSHAFVSFSGAYCWPHLLEIIFSAETNDHYA